MPLICYLHGKSSYKLLTSLIIFFNSEASILLLSCKYSLTKHGRETLEYLINNDDISVDLYYFKHPNEDGLLGRVINGKYIEIFVPSHPVKTKM